MEGLDWVHIYEDSMNVLMNVELKCFFLILLKLILKSSTTGKSKVTFPVTQHTQTHSSIKLTSLQVISVQTFEVLNYKVKW